MQASQALTARVISRRSQQYERESAAETEDVLAELADGSGGTFFHNNNDLRSGFARVAAGPEVSYVLGSRRGR